MSNQSISSPDLSVIIPTHNAQDKLGNLLDELLAVELLKVQILVVDDFSSDGTAELIKSYAEANDNLEGFFHESNFGAGIARNTAFPHATGRYTIFFDDDDEIHTDALVKAVTALDRGKQDVAIMKYDYRRSTDADNTDMTNVDIALWDKFVDRVSARTLSLSDAPELLNLTNYPWNKVIRTETYQKAGLRFGSTMVNNDILGHWYTLLFADRILMLNTVVCTHVVLQGGANLTNQFGRERLSLVDALDETYTMLEAYPTLRSRYAHLYWASVIRVANWAQPRLAKEVKPEFSARLRDHLMRIRISDFNAIATKRDPGLARDIVRRSN